MRGPAQSRGRRKRLGILCEERQTDAVWNLSRRRLLHRLRRSGGWLQNRHWRALQTIRHVLVQTRSGKYPGLALYPQQSTIGTVLEIQTQ